VPLIQILGSYATHGFTKLEKEVVLGSGFFYQGVPKQDEKEPV